MAAGDWRSYALGMSQDQRGACPGAMPPRLRAAQGNPVGAKGRICAWGAMVGREWFEQCRRRSRGKMVGGSVQLDLRRGNELPWSGSFGG